MQEMTVEEIKAALANPKSFPDPLLALQAPQSSSLPVRPEEPEATALEISGVITDVLLVKQLALTEDQRTSLTAELMMLHVRPKRLREMAENVKRRCTFGTIAFEHWITDDIVTGEELREERRRNLREHTRDLANLEALVEMRIRQRIQECRHTMSEAMQKADREVAELAAWQDRCSVYRRAVRAWYDNAAVRAKRRLADCKAKLRAMDRETRVQVWELAKRRGDTASYDLLMVEHSHLFPHVLCGAVEEMGKEVSR